MALLLTISNYAQEFDNKVPNFALENIDGDYVELNSLLGKGPILIAFWATWCKPCIEELQHFQKIYNEFEKDGLQILAISTDSEKSVAKVKPFIKTKKYSFPVLLDTNSEVARDYYATAMPFTVILDKSGKVVYSHLGYKKGDELKVKEIIIQLLESR